MIASTSATRPSSDWTSANATVRGPADRRRQLLQRSVPDRDASVGLGEEREDDRREVAVDHEDLGAGRHGRRDEPTRADVCEPIATCDGSVPTSRAYAARGRHRLVVARRSALPAAQTSIASCIASAVARAGSPQVAASR